MRLASSVSITRPAELAKELFTHKGSGTLIRRGEKVLSFTSWDGIDRARLRGLIESSFGRTLVDDYFERTTPFRVYVSENYRTAVILTVAEGLTYLDKFAVLDEAQGEGLGRAPRDLARRTRVGRELRVRRLERLELFDEHVVLDIRDDRVLVDVVALVVVADLVAEPLDSVADVGVLCLGHRSPFYHANDRATRSSSPCRAARAGTP